MYYTFSLVMATMGRKEEIELFLKSIKVSDYPVGKVQIIIVDQNDPETIDISSLLESFREYLDILHIRSSKKGLSLNRNIGLKHATGEVIAFPDDDCTYFPDTLTVVNNLLRKHSQIDLLLGRICDEHKSNRFRNWPKREIKINKRNFYTKLSSITTFFRKEALSDTFFNEKLGVGTYFGACEDADIIYRTIKKYKSLYSPEIALFHPDMDISNISRTKFYSYGLGFGAFIKSNFDLYLLWLFLKVEFFHLLKMILAFLSNDKANGFKRYDALKSRVKGFIEYP